MEDKTPAYKRSSATQHVADSPYQPPRLTKTLKITPLTYRQNIIRAGYYQIYAYHSIAGCTIARPQVEACLKELRPEDALGKVAYDGCITYA
ncbi:hypothetical protein [Rothia sp. ZJ1223]|uniref:hypothetical protein n=1 Tax=Rothia sp. ZJ1223 TaxID=2811098 RepID=UPI0019597FB3|nr:hypothetical protein [Rothia sp. ZJ1223]MBM7051832.1 hypothetical protein [Rothia sp. ZJ1223]